MPQYRPTFGRKSSLMSRSALHRVAIALALAGAFLAWPAAAQEAGVRVYEEELRVKLDEQSLAARDSGVDGGGWFSFAFFNFDDASARRHRTLRQYQIRAWASANLQGVHKGYIRGLFGWDDWNTGDNPPEGDEDTGPEIERVWYQFDLGQLLTNRSGKPSPIRANVRVGRDFAQIGTALVLSMPLDMVRMEVKYGDWEVMALLAKTRSATPNIDDSGPVSDRQQRCFYGGEVAYTGFNHHRPFAYFLCNQDHTAEKPLDPFQNYEYSSRYLGVGSTGNIALPGMRYQTELVWESGRTYSNQATVETDRICAWAYDVLLEYLWETDTHPRFMVEYMFGSGDADRAVSATATVGGNRQGTTDHAFNAFGFRDTGIAFAPEISNLHIYAAGASFQPLEHIKLCKKMQVGAKAFFYHKATGSGAISDTTATRPNQWVGWEMDVYCDWRLTSDLTWTVRYGAFQPGEAFHDRTCRQFLYTALTLSF